MALNAFPRKGAARGERTSLANRSLTCRIASPVPGILQCRWRTERLYHNHSLTTSITMDRFTSGTRVYIVHETAGHLFGSIVHSDVVEGHEFVYVLLDNAEQGPVKMPTEPIHPGFVNLTHTSIPVGTCRLPYFCRLNDPEELIVSMCLQPTIIPTHLSTDEWLNWIDLSVTSLQRTALPIAPVPRVLCEDVIQAYFEFGCSSIRLGLLQLGTIHIDSYQPLRSRGHFVTGRGAGSHPILQAYSSARSIRGANKHPLYSNGVTVISDINVVTYFLRAGWPRFGRALGKTGVNTSGTASSQC
ncbi:hypothetical protein K474DRAFT_1674410 [Panus rudis PR-1116 ss-1]|nr:hypothetical protein K474DRAFT_1674410 [Panus rudis PR-1116 ss-1]